MKRSFGIAITLLLCCSVASAQGLSVGANMGSWDIPDPEGRGSLSAEGTGFYVSVMGKLSGVPVSVVGSHSSFNADEVTLRLGSGSVVRGGDSFASLLKVLVAYHLPEFPLAVGLGFVEQYIELGEMKFTTSGLSVGACGSTPLSDKLDIAGEFSYLPSANLKATRPGTEDYDAEFSGYAIDLSGSYQVTNELAIEVGYRSSAVNRPDDSTLKTGGTYVGAKLRL